MGKFHFQVKLALEARGYETLFHVVVIPVVRSLIPFTVGVELVSMIIQAVPLSLIVWIHSITPVIIRCSSAHRVLLSSLEFGIIRRLLGRKSLHFFNRKTRRRLWPPSENPYFSPLRLHPISPKFSRNAL